MFTLDDYTTISTRWKNYKRRFEKLIVALNVTDDRQKKALLLNYTGEEAYEVYEKLTTGAEDETYEAVITSLDGHFAPKRKKNSLEEKLVRIQTCFRCGGSYAQTAQCPATGKTHKNP